MTDFETPRLIADIGGTYARFALETAPGRFERAASLRCADHADFHAAVSAYLATQATQATQPGRPIEHAAVAIANPVEGDAVRMTNYHWQFSIEQMRQRLGLATLVVVNDFTALAMAVPRLPAADLRQVGGGQVRQHSVVGVLGAGTGLGVSGLIPAAEGWVALGTEGGHTHVAPRDEREMDILRFAWGEFEHVSFERLLSGPGLALIHRALVHRAGKGRGANKHSVSAHSSAHSAANSAANPAANSTPLSAPEITRRGLAGSDVLCVEAIEVFCLLLGTAASNLAVTLGALGGIYIGGGIVPRLGRHFDASGFRARFEDKGRFSDYVRAIPTYVITAENATFAGASAILQSQLRALDSAPRSAILEQIRRGLGDLSPAEKRVAEHVIAHPRETLNDPIAEIAKSAAVSQPTVIRFCRSLGCEGLSDFKLRLASSLSGTVPLMHAQVTGDDSSAELGDKVLSNSASAVLQLRDQLNRESIARATTLLDGAERIEFHALGNASVVAQDAQFKFLRFGIACNARTDPRLQVLAAKVMGPKDVAVIISGHGRADVLLQAADAAQARGATVIAITASQSPLARKADLALIVDHVELLDTHVSMVSRILHLLVIDILAVGVAMRRSGGVGMALGAETGLPALASRRGAPAGALPGVLPGVSTATPLARLTSHSS